MSCVEIRQAVLVGNIVAILDGEAGGIERMRMATGGTCHSVVEILEFVISSLRVDGQPGVSELLRP